MLESTSVTYQASEADESDIILISVSASHQSYGTERGCLSLSNGDATLVEDAASDLRRRWVSLSVAFVIVFMESIQISIYLVSLWPYLTEIDTDATEIFLGIIQMSVGIAGVISAPVFGYWVNRIHQTRIPIATGICISIAGNLLFAFIEAFPSRRKWVMLAARSITGLGIGNYAALLTYVVSASTARERSKAVGIRAACSSGGMMTGPALQTLFIPIGFPGLSHGVFQLNMYTAAAYANIIIGTMELIVLATLFKEYWIPNTDSYQNQDNRPVQTSFDKVSAAVCIWSRFVFCYIMAYEFTLMAPFTMVMFNWSASKAVLYNGLIMTVAAVINIIGSIIVGTVVLRYVLERTALVVGIITYVLFFIISFSWPDLPPLTTTTTGNYSLYANSLLSNIVASQIASPGTANGTCLHLWCTYTTRIYLAQYLVAFLFYALSASIGYTTNSTLFSKILGPVEQGTLQGIFTGVGLFANTIGPWISSFLFHDYGPRVAWTLCIIILTSALLAVGFTYRRLVPHRGNYQILP